MPDSFRGAAELCLSSDDLFSLDKPPGKTLVVGGSYVALECAGFLHGLGYNVTLLMRSIPLRGFDRDCSERVLGHMAEAGTRVLQHCLPASASATPDGRIRVSWRRVGEGEEAGGDEAEEFDTVLVAAGRLPETTALNLRAAGVAMRSDGKVATQDEVSSVPHIFCIGDAAGEAPSGRPELTPVAIRAGQLLARRLYGGGSERLDCSNVPTVVFTPLEYGCVGLSEEAARARLGEALEVYHTEYAPLEQLALGSPPSRCYAKLLVDTSDGERVVGVHIVGDGAGEIVQGFAVALRCGATKADFDRTIGVHPTSSEELVSLRVTKSSGEAAVKAGC